MIKGNLCQSKTPGELDLHDSVLLHPQALNLAERMERAVYLGLDGKKITAKYVAGRKVI